MRPTARRALRVLPHLGCRGRHRRRPQALGYERIALYGDSYGTYLGQSYAYRHPDRLEALVLDSAYPARGETAWYSSLPRTGIRSLSIACNRSPKCEGDARRLLERLTGHLRETNRGVGPLIDALVDAAYGPPGTYLRIVDAGRDLLDGRPAPGAGSPTQASPARGASATTPGPASSWSAATTTRCSGSAPPPSPSAAPSSRRRSATRTRGLRPVHAARGRALLGDRLPLLPHLAAANRALRAAGREGAEPTEAPVLVVSGELDSVTTPREGMRVAGEFPDST